MTSNAINYKKAKDDRDMREKEWQETRRSNLVKEDTEKLKAKAAWEKAKGSNIKDVTSAINSSTRQMYDAGVGIASAINDFNWYTNYGDLELNTLKQAIENYAEYDDHSDRITGTAYLPAEFTFESHMFKQSIFAYKFQTTLGNAGDYASPTALAVREFNTAVRKDNFSTQSYDSVDLFMYPLAFDSITYFLCWILRGLALVNYADARDPSTVVHGLLRAHCYNITGLVDTFLNDRAAVLDLYNQAVVKLNALNVPIQLPYIKRHAFLALNIFTQGEGVGKSYYLMNPNSYYYYDEANGVLQCVDMVSKLSSGSITRLRMILDAMIIPLTNSQSIAIMSGDIDRAMGTSHPFTTIPQSGMDKLTPSFVDDPKYMMSIKNADIVTINDPVGGELSDFDIKQGDDGNANPYLYQGSTAGISIAPYQTTMWNNTDGEAQEVQMWESSKHIVDYYDSTQITEEDQCYNTSFKVVTTGNRLTHCRSEIIVEERYYTYTPNNRDIRNVSTRKSNFVALEHATDDTLDLETVKDDFEFILKMAQFKYIPKVIVPYYYTGENHFYLAWNANKNRNYISDTVLAKIQDVTLLSMFKFEVGGDAGVKASVSNKRNSNRKFRKGRK